MDPASQPGAPALHAHLLGPVRLALGARALSDDVWPRRAPRSLLLLLLMTPGHRLPRDQLLEQLWPGASLETALNALYVALHALRRVLEPDLRSGRASSYVELAGGVIRLRPEAIAWVDVVVFEAELGHAGAPNRREHLAAALALYAGDLLPDDLYVDWPIVRREHLRAAWRDAAIEYADLEREAGRPLLAVPAVERVLERDPTDEPAYRAVMRALATAGRREDALRWYERCVAALRNELGLEPGPETEALRAAVQDAPPAAGAGIPAFQSPRPARFDNLPAAPNPLVGRTRELETLQDLLWDHDVRLVTITGPGGIGKTRLALEAAAQVADDFADGVCFAALSSIRDPALVLPTFARTLGVEEAADRPGAESLREALRQRALLLVLDNMEQLVAAGPAVADLIAACPGLKVLVTSREPLRLRAEHVFSVPTLAVPRLDPDDHPSRLTADAVHRYEAVVLFAERARAVQRSFVLTEENAGAVATVCHRLDGLPLAIELAAARSRHLTPAELRTRLAKRLPLLTDGPRDLPPRQRTMRDAIAWSHDLLTAEEQMLFRRLSVFVGGFALDAAERVMGNGEWVMEQSAGPSPITHHPLPSILNGISSLVDKSLLQREEEDARTRFRMLETIREYAAERLEASGEGAATRDAHAAYVRDLAETAAPLLHGGDQSAWLDRLDAEHDNVRAALGWACDRQDAATALRLSGTLSEFWKMRGHLREGRAWLERTLALGDGGPGAARARALEGSGNLARALGDNEAAAARLTAAVDDWRGLGDRRGTGGALGSLADVATARGDYDRAIGLNQQALELFEATGDRSGIADALNRLGIIAMDQGEHARATDLYERSLALYRALAHRHGEARVLNNLGAMAFWQEDYRRAAALHEASLALWRAMGDRPHTAVVLANLGEDLRAEGDLDRAMAIAKEGLQLSRELGDKRSTATALFILGSLVQHDGADPRAADPLVEGILLYRQVGDRLGMAWCLEALAGPAVAGGWPDLAVKLCGAADALREQVCVPLQPAERPIYERHLNDARATLGQAEFTQAWATGRTLPLEAVVAQAAGLASAQAPTAAPP